MKSICRFSFRRFISFVSVVFMLALVIGFLATPVSAEVFMVTSLSDDVPGSLRAAIASADSYDDVISFDVTGTITLSSRLKIQNDMEIQGPGADLLTVSGNDNDCVFSIDDMCTSVKISGISIVRGSYPEGGGIYNPGAYLTVTDCTFSDNHALLNGGGMYNYEFSPTVTNCTFSDNDAVNDGGGMYNFKSSPTVTNCTFSDNHASGNGGGMYNEDSSPTVTNCTFSDNYARLNGGGMYNEGSSPTVTNCTFSSNIASNLDGGGGMYNASVSSPTLINCIFWNDTDTEIYNSEDSISDLSYCVVENSDVSGLITISGPIYVSDPNLGSLQNNGGPTMTYALGAGSSAIDTGCTLSEVSTDQRGVLRPQGASFDIGAYEARTFVITGISNGEGGILPESADVQEGSTMDFYVYPEPDYYISGVYVDGNPVSFDEVNCCYTFENVSADHVISADFWLGATDDDDDNIGDDDDDDNGSNGGGGGGCNISALSGIALLLVLPLMFLSRKMK